MTKEFAQGLMNIYSRQLDKWISIIFSVFVVIKHIMCYSNLVVIEIIRKYKINKHPRKLDLNRKIPQTKVNTRNLVQVKLNSEAHRNKSNNIRLTTINIKSIKNKVEYVNQN